MKSGVSCLIPKVNEDPLCRSDEYHRLLAETFERKGGVESLFH
jgi:hypothetical protein